MNVTCAPQCRAGNVTKGDQAAREDYFGKMWAELESGGLEALAYDLLHEDLADFSAAQVPKTRTFLEMAGLDADRDPLRGWYREILEKGELPETASKDRRWTAHAPKRALYDDYTGGARPTGRNPSEEFSPMRNGPSSWAK